MKMKRKFYLGLLLVFMVVANAFSQTLIAPAGKKIMKSDDGGKTWSMVWDAGMDSRIPGACVTSVAQGNGLIVVVGSTLVVSADKGQSWKEVSLMGHTGSNNVLEKYLSHVAFGDGVFILAFPFRVLYSTDAINWSYIRKDQPANLSGGETASGTSGGEEKKGGKGLSKLKGLASGSSSSSSSSSGSKTATSQANPKGLDEGVDFLKSPAKVTFVNGTFFLTGGNRSMEMAAIRKEGNELKVIKVYDLYADYGNAATLPIGGLGNIATDGKSLVVVAQGSSKSGYSLDNGATWKFMRNPAEKQSQSVAFGNGMYVAVNGFSDVFYTSDITKGWTGQSQFYSMAKNANRILFDGKKFIVVCHNLEVYTSADAKTWTALTDGPQVGDNLYDIVMVK